MCSCHGAYIRRCDIGQYKTALSDSIVIKWLSGKLHKFSKYVVWRTSPVKDIAGNFSLKLIKTYPSSARILHMQGVLPQYPGDTI